VLDCSIARPLGEVVSATTAHCPGPPWPVRPKSKSSGGAPTRIDSIVIIVVLLELFRPMHCTQPRMPRSPPP